MLKLTKTDRSNFIQLIAFSVFIYFLSSNSYLDEENIAVYSLNYQHGIMENGFLGMFYQKIVGLLGLDATNYLHLQHFILIFTALYFVLLMLLFQLVIIKTTQVSKKNTYLLLVITSIVLAGNFGLHKNFGSVDLYLAVITLICALLLLNDACVFLVIPLAALGQCIYSGYIVTYYVVLLGMLIYYSKTGAKKYKDLLVASAIVVGGVCLALHLLNGCADSGSRLLDSAKQGKALLKGIMESADNASRIFGESEVTPDIYGKIVCGVELWITKKHIIECLLALVLFLPFLWEIFSFLKHKIGNTSLSKTDKLLLGLPVVMLPRAFLHSGTGRIVFLILFYMLLMTMMAVADNRESICNPLEKTFDGLSERKIYGVFLLIYLIMLFPTWGTSINWMTGHLANIINVVLLHIW